VASASCASSARCLAPFLETTSLATQALYVGGGDPRVDFLVPGDFTRWRELNVTMNIPQRLLRWNAVHVKFSNASIGLQGRNLALWTKYAGPDPESRDAGFNSARSIGIPQARTWAVRFDVTP